MMFRSWRTRERRIADARPEGPPGALAPPGTGRRCLDGSGPRSTRLPADACTVAGLPAAPSTTAGDARGHRGRHRCRRETADRDRPEPGSSAALASFSRTPPRNVPACPFIGIGDMTNSSGQPPSPISSRPGSGSSRPVSLSRSRGRRARILPPRKPVMPVPLPASGGACLHPACSTRRQGRPHPRSSSSSRHRCRP